MKKLFLIAITSLNILSIFPACGRHETELVIFFNLFDGTDNYICSINEDGGGFKKIAGPFQAVTNPVSSPDGTRIAFSNTVTIGPNTMAQIWTMNTDGSNMKQETSPAADMYHYFPAWSADSRYIYFVEYDTATGYNYSALYRLDMENGTVTANSSHSFYNACSVACYKDYIAYYDYAVNWINVLDIHTNLNTYSTGLNNLSYPTYFYDGRLAGSLNNLIYIYTSDFSSSSTADFSGQGLVPIHPAISPDGENIVFVDSTSGYLYIYNVKSGGNAVLLKSGTCHTPNYIAKPR